MESRKMVLMNLFAGQQWRHIENRLVDKGGGEKEEYRMCGENNRKHITVCKIDSQREFAV